MSFEEKVERQKSARWARASAANYDGDDWSDDEYEEKKVPEVPQLPQLPQAQDIPIEQKQEEEYDSSNQATPNINLEQQFKAIDLNDDTDEYVGLIQDDNDEEDEEEYKPRASERFQAVREELPVKKPDVEEPQDTTAQPTTTSQGQLDGDETEDETDHVAKLDQYIGDTISTYSRSEKGISRETSVRRSLNEEPQTQEKGKAEHDFEIKDKLTEGQRSPTIVDSPALNLQNHFADEPIQLPTQNEILPVNLSSQVESENVSDSNFDDEYIGAVPDDSSDDEYNYDDSERSQDDYVPGKYHFNSGLAGEITDHQEETKEAKPFQEPIQRPVITINDNKSEHSLNKKNLSLEPTQPFAQLQPPPVSPALTDLSDADTLHIQDPHEDDNESDGSSVIEIKKPEVYQTNTSAATVEEDFNEHAYLGSIIDTPDPNRGEFSHSGDHELSPEAKELEEAPNETSEPRRSSDFRDSKFYSSVNDYFDDYAEENVEKQSLSKLDTRSSGSLSTGGASIKSENDYRSSKLSDRTASFTNQSFSQQSDAQSYAESINEGGVKDSASLNPALSINLGQWRPNTDSFRDQFISGSAPPVPNIDNYTRNSIGEIVEENGSIAESNVESLASKGDELNASFESSGKEIPSQAAYRTRTNSLIPTHIELSTPDLNKDKNNNYFHENLTDPNLKSASETEPAVTNKDFTPKKVQKQRPKSISIKQIMSSSDSTDRISKYRELREIELNIDSGLSQWLEHAMAKAEVVSYKSSGSSNNVARAYAEASTNSKKHTHNNLGSILQTRRVLHDTGSTAQSFAKGLFSRGKKIIKSDK